MKIKNILIVIGISLTSIQAQDELGSILDAAEFKKTAPIDTTSGLQGTSESASLKIAFIDMNRLFTEYPDTKKAEEKLNASRSEAKAELDEKLADLKSLMNQVNQTSGARRDQLVEQARTLDKEIADFRTTREKKLQDTFLEMRKEIIKELNIIVNEVAAQNNINVIYDKSGMSMGQVPVVIYTNGVFDITDACIEKARSR
jgi:Skp family chaperone for outer membrane proteins